MQALSIAAEECCSTSLAMAFAQVHGGTFDNRWWSPSAEQTAHGHRRGPSCGKPARNHAFRGGVRRGARRICADNPARFSPSSMWDGARFRWADIASKRASAAGDYPRARGPATRSTHAVQSASVRSLAARRWTVLIWSSIAAWRANPFRPRKTTSAARPIRLLPSMKA